VYLDSNKKSLKIFRRKLRKHSTPAERKLWVYIRDRRFHNKKFKRQYSLGKYIYDFYCPEEKLVIELDGEYIHADKDIYETDKAKELFTKSLGIKLLRYSNRDISNNLEEVLQNLKDNFQS
jgi:very-short-patch-repair endonuclease